MATVETCYFEVDSFFGDPPHAALAELDVRIEQVYGGPRHLNTWRIVGDYANCVWACDILEVDDTEINWWELKA
jgi:hypothetical protein